MKMSKKAMLARYFKKAQKAGVRRVVLEKGVRLDGPGIPGHPPDAGEVDVLPGTHGSAIFTRGETQAINLVTLGSRWTSRPWTRPCTSAAMRSCCTTTSPASARAK